MQKYNGKTFKEIYTEYCDGMILKLGDKIDFIEKYLGQEKGLRKFIENDTKPKFQSESKNIGANKKNIEDILKNINRKNHEILFLYNKEYKRVILGLPSINTFENSYLNGKNIGVIISKLNDINDIGKNINIDSIPKITEKLKSFLKHLPSEKNKGKECYTKEYKKIYKEDKKSFYRALECALIYIHFHESSNNKEILKKLIRLDIKENNALGQKKEQGIYIKLGECKYENNENITFYTRGDINYIAICQNNFNKINNDKLSKVFQSWSIERNFTESFKRSFKETTEGEKIFLLTNDFISTLLKFYIENGIKILEWENKILIKLEKDNYPVVKKDNKYIEFSEIIKYLKNVNNNDYKILENINSARNEILHLNLLYETYHIYGSVNKLNKINY